MIRYRLICDGAHEFDAWFRSSADYDRQAEMGLLQCPQCGSSDVSKALMAPNVATSRKLESSGQGTDHDSDSAHSGEQPVQTVANVAAAPAPGGALAGAVPEPVAKLLEAMRQLKQHVRENAEYVGDRFAEEARKIHYEEVEPKAIYGEANAEEAEALAEEGITFHRLPVLPEEKN